MRRCPDMSRSSQSPLTARISAGRVSGAMDFASTGQSAGALVAGLAGTGQIRLAGAQVPHLDQGALGRIVEKAQSPDYAIDQTNINHALEQELNKQALRIADVDAPASLTAGIIHFGPFKARDPRDDGALQASFDLRTFILEIHAAFTELQTPKYWSGAPPAINIVRKGPIAESAREVDSSLFVAGLAAQAIARETDRIAGMESDIRERAFFNRRLKAGQFMRRRELELEAYATEQARLKSEADRRRVEAEILKADEERRKAAAPPERPLPPAPVCNSATILSNRQRVPCRRRRRNRQNRARRAPRSSPTRQPPASIDSRFQTGRRGSPTIDSPLRDGRRSRRQAR